MTNCTVDRTPSLRLVDSHAHLELEPLINDSATVMQRATAAGVIAVITVGIDLADAQAALKIAETFDNVFAAVGFHPHNAKDATGSLIHEMERAAAHPKVVAYGEIGLDFFRNLSPQSIQRSVFNEQLHVAKALDKPVVIHLRNAYEEGLDMIEKVAPFPAGGVVHCFSGNEKDAARALDLGFHLSIPGTVTYRKSDKLRSIVKDLPPDRILIETDCPFLSPEPLRGKTNEPAHIVHTAREVARIRQVSLEEIAEITTQNAVRLFGLPL
ncbi:MAG: TatD family hydrolase [Desulfomonile sp.]|nr:TatD family hydrolase [Desulfomonile sp.]